MNSLYINTLNRFGESGPIPNRKNRIYTIGDDWYFLSREYGVFGPYPSQEKADTALKQFLHRFGVFKLTNF